MALHSKDLYVDFTTHTINTINVSQYDKDSRVFIVHILDNGVEIPLEQNEKLIIKQSKPDNTFVVNDCITNKDGTATLILTDQMCAAQGISNCQFTVTNFLNGTILHTMPFRIRIEKCVIDDTQIESTNEMTTLNRLIIEAETAAKRANDAADDLQHKLDTHHFVLTEDKDVAGGVPSLNSETKIPLAELYDATLSRKGIVQLTDSVSSSSNTTAATPNSIKKTYDKTVSVEQDLFAMFNANTTNTDWNTNRITDCNSAELGKMYTWTPATLNIPISHNGLLYSFGYYKNDASAHWIHQMAWDNNSTPGIYMRKKLDGNVWSSWTIINYTHPTTSGNKHIPAGGIANQILAWNADGTASWNDTEKIGTITTTKKLTLTQEWQDTGIEGSALSTGVYLITVTPNSSDATSMSNIIFSGNMSWYGAATDSNIDPCEIQLHYAGQATNNNRIYIRTNPTPSSNGKLKLQISCKIVTPPNTGTANSFGACDYTFKFKRLI